MRLLRQQAARLARAALLTVGLPITPESNQLWVMAVDTCCQLEPAREGESTEAHRTRIIRLIKAGHFREPEPLENS